MKTYVKSLLACLCLFVCLCLSACDSSTVAGPSGLPLAIADTRSVSSLEVKKPAATATPAPIVAATPAPTPTPFIMPAYPPGGAYDPDAFKIVAAAPCGVFTSADSPGVDLLMILNKYPGHVSAVFANVGGDIVESYSLGTFDVGWYGVHAAWTVQPQPSFAWLTADIAGARYVSDWCTIISR